MSWAAVAGMTFFVYSTVGVVGQNSASPTNIANRATTASSSQSNAVRLSYGVADVLKLAQAQVGEDTIVAFVRNSGTSYNLSAAEIIHLKNQGVPDHVLTAMLEQSKVVETTARIAANAQAASVARAASSAKAYSAQSASTYAPASTVYVVPSSSPSYDYYDYPYYDGYPYYGGYYGYGPPGPALSFGLGSWYYGGGYPGGGPRGGPPGGGPSGGGPLGVFHGGGSPGGGPGGGHPGGGPSGHGR